MSSRIEFQLEKLSSGGEEIDGYVELVAQEESVSSGNSLPVNCSFPALYLADVPAHMIPTDIVTYFASSLSDISSIRIFRHVDGRQSAYCAVLDFVSLEATRKIFDEYNGQTLSSLHKVKCNFRPVSAVVYTRAVQTSFQLSDVEGAEDNGSNCAVCLEPIAIDNPMSITTCCNHRFHMQCIMHVENTLCPVCRFQHDCDDTSASTCFECGTSAICSSNPRFGGVSTYAFGGPKVDLWLCLICGYTGCGDRHGGHIQHHYEETLHTYAQNVDSRQVWDFAGDGYVHRLILSEGSSSPTNILPPKLIESNAQHTSSAGFRNRTAPLSADQEEMLVNGKLEAAARHYNQLLAWQLEQNRLLYQARLSRIRESISGGMNTSISAGGKTDGYSTVGQSTPSNTSASSSSTGGAKLAHGGTNWRENLILTLRTERGKVAKQVEGAKERLERTRKEIAVLKELRTSLDANRQEWQKRVDVAAQGLAELKQTYQRDVPVLEERVRVLMEKLDMAPRTATGARVDSSGTAGKDGGSESAT